MKKLALFVFAAALIVGLIFSSGCGFGSFTNLSGIEGSGTAKSEQRNVSGFSKIDAGGAINLEIAFQENYGVSVEADENLLQHIKTEVSGDTLKIHSEGRISPKTKINVKISMPKLSDLDISGASTANVANFKADSIDLTASGASKITISGTATSVKTDASGASSIDAEKLSVEKADVNSSGASKVIVAPLDDLNADASGASSVYYTGDPKNIKQDASGASSIKKK